MAEHGKAKAMEQKERAWRKEKAVRKERIKTKSDHAREAQQAVNAYIRERDKGQPCISCGRMPNFKASIGGSGIQAGHYRSVGACPELRFNELNIHVQCYSCNVILSSNAIDYRIGLIKKIGQEAVEWLEGPHEPARYTIEDLKEIKALYRRKLRELKRNNDAD